MMLKRILKIIESNYEKDREFMDLIDTREYTECINWLKNQIDSVIELEMIEYVHPVLRDDNEHWLFGKLNDGTYFIGDDVQFGVSIEDADPEKAEDNCWVGPWEKEHVVREIDYENSLKSTLNILIWCKINLPAEHEFCRHIDEVLLELRQEMFPI